ncbi:hypothetical protein AI2893V1_0120 [Klebsiella pneumoniae]|nr:hypothetical protein AI2893V1_0120 [Klebsiella pneumoniae]
MRKPINVFIILISVLILTGCDNKPDNMLSGYSHGEFVYLSYSGNEKIERILINKGDNVAAGQELVKIESFDAQNIFLRAEEKLSAEGNDSNLLIVFYVQIMPDDFVMQLHRF